jgi:hypothetical protein
MAVVMAIVSERAVSMVGMNQLRPISSSPRSGFRVMPMIWHRHLFVHYDLYYTSYPSLYKLFCSSTNFCGTLIDDFGRVTMAILEGNSEICSAISTG